jgi:hypothetical protein
MIKILEVTGARGAYFWDINDYYIDGYRNGGNPVNDLCKWTNSIAKFLGLPHKATYVTDD